MSSRNRWIPALLMLAVLGAGCSTDRDLGDLFDPEDVDTIVVDAVFIVNDVLPNVILSRTTEPGRMFEVDQRPIRDAIVIVRSPWWEHVYRRRARGTYGPDQGDLGVRVEPNTKYELRVTTPQGELVTATTTTPADFSVAQWVVLDDEGEEVREVLKTYVDFPGESGEEEIFLAPENQVVYSDGLLEARFDRPDVPAFQIGLFSRSPGADFVIDPDFFEEEDFEDLERNESSPPLEGLDGSLRLPWFAIFFEGKYQIKVYALDNNWYDLVRSSEGLGGGGPGFGGTIGDNFDRPIFNIEGGIGLFGSASVDSVGFFILPD